MQKCALIIATPFQLFNAINLLDQEYSNKDFSIDLFFRMDFSNCGEMLEKLKKYYKFANVYTFSESFANSNGIQRDIDAVYGILYPKSFLRHRLHQRHHITSVIQNKYTQIIMGYYIHFSIAMLLIHNEADIILFDEGLNSYLKTGYDCFDKRKKFLQCLHRKFPDITPKFLYLNNPEYSKTMVTKHIKKIFPNADEQNEKINDIFSYTDSSIYDSRRIVYLSQFTDNLTAKKSKSRVEKELKKFDEDIICRPHPSEIKNSADGWSSVDSNENMWELICKNQITGNHILVGAYSTAQFSPKFLCDKEPWLIFTYKLFPEGPTKKEESITEIILTLKNAYRDKKKVIVVESLEEIGLRIENILKYEAAANV